MKINDLSYNATGARYGYNGTHEQELAINPEGNYLDFGNFGYDTRVAMRRNQEPLRAKYPHLSGYSAFGSNPIMFSDLDGREITIKLDYSYDGKSKIKKFSDIANIKLNDEKKIEVVYNEQTKVFDIYVHLTIQFTKHFNEKGGGLLESLNPGLYREVEAHEIGHSQQHKLLLSSDIKISLKINGESRSYIGRADEILTEILKDSREVLSTIANNKIKSGDLTPESAKTFLYEEFKKISGEAVNLINKELQSKINEVNHGVKYEADANKRAADYLGNKDIKYINGKTEIKNEKGKPVEPNR